MFAITVVAVTDLFQGNFAKFRCRRNINILCLDAGKEYEFECFIRPTAATAGNIVAVRNESSDLMAIGKDTANRITLTGMGVALASTTLLTLNQFTHVLVRLSQNSASIYINGQLTGSASGLTGVLSATELRVGGVAGQIDEFMFSHRAGTSIPAVPTHPYQGIVDYRTLGGFGDGKHGKVTPAGTNVNLNTYALASGVSAAQIYIGTQTVGMFGEFEVGDEVMIHNSLKRDPAAVDEANLGLYSIRRIKSIEGSSITLDRAIDEFVPQGNAYYLQIVKIPNFVDFVLPAGVTVKPPVWDNAKGGGIVALKCTGNCDIRGKIISALSGPIRTDSLYLTHTDMIDRFVLAGNVFIMAKGTLSATTDARIGSDFPGDGRGGAGGTNAYGTSTSGVVGAGGTGAGSGNGGASSLGGGEGGSAGRGGKGGLIGGNNDGGGGGGGGGGNWQAPGGAGAGIDGKGVVGRCPAPSIGSTGGGCGYGGGGGNNGRYTASNGGGGAGGGGAGTGFCFIAEVGGA